MATLILSLLSWVMRNKRTVLGGAPAESVQEMVEDTLRKGLLADRARRAKNKTGTSQAVKTTTKP